MHPWIRQLCKRATLLACAIAAASVGVGPGCAKTEPPKPTKVAYTDLGLKKSLPPYLKDTILERTDLANTGPLAVSSFGLIVNLRYSGDSRRRRRCATG